MKYQQYDSDIKHVTSLLVISSFSFMITSCSLKILYCVLIISSSNRSFFCLQSDNSVCSNCTNDDHSYNVSKERGIYSQLCSYSNTMQTSYIKAQQLCEQNIALGVHRLSSSCRVERYRNCRTLHQHLQSLIINYTYQQYCTNLF